MVTVRLAAGQFLFYTEEIPMNILIGNIISLAACTVMVLIGFIKNKQKIMLAQCLQFTLHGIAHFVLGGISGAIGCAVSLVRNVVFFKVKITPALKIAFIILQVVLSIGAVSFNPVTWMPILSVALFTWYLDTEDVIKLKWVMIATLVMWIIYDAYHLNFISSAFDIFTIVSTGYSIRQIKKENTENA